MFCEKGDMINKKKVWGLTVTVNFYAINFYFHYNP